MMYAFINLNAEGESPVRVRVDQIAAVELSIWGKTHVTTLSGTVLTGSRPLDDVWDAMRTALDWLAEDGA